MPKKKGFMGTKRLIRKSSNKKVFCSSSAGVTEKIAVVLSKVLPKKGNVVILFFGGLGYGKTTFIRGLVKGLGLNSGVASPTFKLVNVYKTRCRIVYHLDLYRLTTVDDVLSVGYEDIITSPHVVAIEWAEKFEDIYPKERIEVRLMYVSPEQRKVVVKTCGLMYNGLLTKLTSKLEVGKV